MLSDYLLFRFCFIACALPTICRVLFLLVSAVLLPPDLLSLVLLPGLLLSTVLLLSIQSCLREMQSDIHDWLTAICSPISAVNRRML